MYNSLSPEDNKGDLFASFCDSSIVWQNKPPVFIVRNIEDLNSVHSDFSPVFYDDGIIFSSDRILNYRCGAVQGKLKC